MCNKIVYIEKIAGGYCIHSNDGSPDFEVENLEDALKSIVERIKDCEYLIWLEKLEKY